MEHLPAAAPRLLRLAIVGTGRWARDGIFLHFRVASHGAKVVAVCDVDEGAVEAALQAWPGALPFTSSEALYEQASVLALDAVVISTPHAFHFADATLALRLGLSILIEKPMCTSAEDAAALVAAADTAGVRAAFVCHTANFRPEAVEASRLVARGALGPVSHVQCHMASGMARLFSGGEDASRTSTWADPMGGGGYAYGQLVHALAFALRVSGLRPLEVACHMVRGPVGVDMCSSASVRCAGGATLAVSGSALLPFETRARGKQVAVRVFGPKGALSLVGRDREPGGNGLEIELDGGAADHGVDGCYSVLDGGFRFEETTRPLDAAGEGYPQTAKLPDVLAHWLAACRGQPHFDGASLELGWRVTALVDAMHRSAREGRFVQVNYGGAPPPWYASPLTAAADLLSAGARALMAVAEPMQHTAGGGSAEAAEGGAVAPPAQK